MVDKVEGLIGLIVAAIGALGGVSVAWIRGKYSNSRRISELEGELDEINNKFESLKLAFELVFDQMEREHVDNPDRMQILKDFRKSFDL